MSAQSADLNELKTVLRGLLISTRKAMTADDLQRDYKNQEGREIPYKQFGFRTLLDLLRSISDTVKVEHSFGCRSPVITPVLSEKSSHVEALVQKQKVNPPRHGHIRTNILRRNAVHPSVERPKILIPHQLQQRLVTLLARYPEGAPIVRVEKELQPGILRNYGVNCSVPEFLGNLGHIVRVINGRVFLLQETIYSRSPPPFCINFNSRYRFMPPRLDNVVQLVNIEQRQDYNLRNETYVNLNHYEMKPGGFEDEENTHDYVQNGDLNIMEFSEDIENDHIGRGADDNYNKVTISTEENMSQSEDIPTNSTPECGSVLINNTLRNNFRALLDKNPGGIQCSKLPRLYKENFKVELDYRQLGFFSVFQMVSNLTDIFHCIRHNGEDWKVLDARNPLSEEHQSCDVKTTTKVFKNTQPHVPTKIKNNVERLLMLNCSGLWSDFFLDKYKEMFGHSINFKELNFDSLESFLLFLNGVTLHMRYVKERIMLYPQIEEEQEPKTDKPLPPITEPMDLFVELYPSEVLGPRDTIPQQKLPPDISSGSFLEVIVAEVYTPHNFWLQLRGERTHLALDKLMNEIQSFYSEQFDYQMPELTVRENQYCMAPYNDELHRARVIAVPNLIEAQVCFVDYGTKSKVKKTDLRFMHQDFAKFPVQAIKASLANIKPTNGVTKWPLLVSQRFLQLVSDKNLVAIVSSANHQNRELEVALVDTTGEEDIHINDTLKHEGLADYKTSVSSASALPPSLPATQQGIEIENVVPTSRRPPPGFTSVSASPAPPQSTYVPSAAATASATNIKQEVPFPGVGQPCFVPPASSLPYVNPVLNNPIASSMDPLFFNMQLQQAYLCSLFLGNPAISALMYGNSLAALTNPFGMPKPNVPEMLNPHMNKNTNSGIEANVSKVPLSRSEVAEQCVPNSLSPESHSVSKSSTTVEMSKFNVPNVLETESEKTIDIVRKDSNSTMSTDSSMLEQFDVLSLNTPVAESENVDSELDSEDEETIFRSDDEDTDVVENISEKSVRDRIKTEPSPEPVRPLYVKNVQIAKKLVHIINVQSVPYICTDELVRLFTEFSGRHVILKILDARAKILPFREISRRESHDIFEAVEAHDIVGLQRSFIAGNIMGKIHLTPLLSLPQLLTLLNVRNRELFRGIQEEIDRFNSEDLYWSTMTE